MDFLKYIHEKKLWKEKLVTEIAAKIIDKRIENYNGIWSILEVIGEKNLKNSTFLDFEPQKIASKIREWRYTSSGLLADNKTREIAYHLQKGLWNYHYSKDTKNIIELRNQFRDALRADAGFEKYEDGKSIFDRFSKIMN